MLDTGYRYQKKNVHELYRRDALGTRLSGDQAGINTKYTDNY